jgi:hypothetical protein
MVNTRAVLATATLQDAAVDMSGAQGLVGRAAHAEVGREARLLHVKHIVTVPMLPTERIAVVTGLCDGNESVR